LIISYRSMQSFFKFSQCRDNSHSHSHIVFYLNYTRCTPLFHNDQAMRMRPLNWIQWQKTRNIWMSLVVHRAYIVDVYCIARAVIVNNYLSLSSSDHRCACRPCSCSGRQVQSEIDTGLYSIAYTTQQIFLCPQFPARIIGLTLFTCYRTKVSKVSKKTYEARL